MKSKINLKLLLFIGMLSVSLIAPFSAGAAGLVPCGDPGPITSASQLPEDKNPCQLADIFKLIARVTNFLIAFSGLYAIYRIIRSSVNMIMSGGNEESIKTSRTNMEHAITGLVLVMLAYLFVNTVFGVFGPKVNGQSGFLYNPFQ